MKKIALLSFILVTNCFAQVNITIIQPGLFYTHGNYSSGSVSNGYSGFADIVINNFDLARIGYTKISFDNPDWTYDQNNLSFGGVKNFYPFYVKASYLSLKGEFVYKPLVSKYTDELYTLATEVDYNYDLFYLGVNFAYTDYSTTSDSLTSMNLKQIGIPLTYSPSSVFLISLTPTFVLTSDRGNLFSTEILLKYSPVKNVTAYLSGLIGERAYFYDNNLYTIYNQNSTQKSAASITAEYKLFDLLSCYGGFTYTEFEDYNIKYYTGGLKLNL